MQIEKWVYQIHPDETASPRECVQFLRLPDLVFISSFRRYFYPELFLEIINKKVTMGHKTYVDGYDKDKFFTHGAFFGADLMRAVYGIKEEDGVTYKFIDFIPEKKIAIAFA